MEKIIRFDNFPEYERFLKRIRVLEEHETEITLKELVERTLQKEKFTQVLDLFNNELRNQKMNLDVDGSSSQVKNAVDQIHDQSTLINAQVMVDAVDKSLDEPLEQVILAMDCLAEFEEQMKPHHRKLLGQLSDMALQHLREIIETVSQIDRDVELRRQMVNTMRRAIEEKRSRL
jgi:hypothetical protein